jgi:hypothetical protein
VLVHVSSGYNSEEGNERASRNVPVRDLSPETPNFLILYYPKPRNVTIDASGSLVPHLRRTREDAPVSFCGTLRQLQMASLLLQPKGMPPTGSGSSWKAIQPGLPLAMVVCLGWRA